MGARPTQVFFRDRDTEDEMAASGESATIDIQAGRSSVPLDPFLSAVGYVNVDFSRAPPVERMYEYLSSYHNHVHTIRMHNTLTAHGQGDRFLLMGDRDFGNPGDMRPEGADSVVSLDAGGRLRFDWSVLDGVFDLVVGHGMRAIVETDFLPSCLRTDEELWYVPRDYTLWEETVRRLAEHLAERYGAETIRTWHFEIWNEPDIFPAWQEDPESFYALYDYMERAVHSVDGGFSVGGPAVTERPEGRALFRGFLEHCCTGVNYATGARGTRVDFLSVHCKAGTLDDRCPASGRIFASLDAFLDIRAEFPRYSDTPLFNDESGIVWGGNREVADASWLNFRNTHYAAGFVCKLQDLYCRRLEDGRGVRLGVMDIDNCQLPWERSLFSGNRSQLTPLYAYPSTDLVRKPLFNAYVLLSRLGDRRLQATCRDPGFGEKFGCLPTAWGDGPGDGPGRPLAIMVWNFEDGMEDGINTRELKVRLDGLPAPGEDPGRAGDRGKEKTSRYRLVHYRIDADHSSAYRAWRAIGSPPRPDAEQIRSIRAAEGLELAEPVREVHLGTSLELTVTLPLHGVSLLLLVPENGRAPEPPEWIRAAAETGAPGNPQVFLKWRPAAEPDFLHYVLWRRELGGGDGGSDGAEPLRIAGDPSLNTAVYVDSTVQAGREYGYRLQAVGASGAVSEHSAEIAVKP